MLIRQRGFSLIELMVSIGIGAILMLGLVMMYSTSSKHSNETMEQNRLAQELNATVQMMSADIRRAGYWRLAVNDIGTGQNNNPYMDANTNMDIATNGTNDCILLSYDSYNDGAVKPINTAGDDERYGYRLSNGAIQARPNAANFVCDAAANAWEDITDVNFITITSFAIVKNEVPVFISGTSGPKMIVRDVDIHLTAQLVRDPNTTRTINYNIKVRNDKFAS